MAEKDQIPPMLKHGVGNIGEIHPTGEQYLDIHTGPPVHDPGKAVTPMKAGIGEIPIGNQSADTNMVPQDGLHDVGRIDGKDGFGKPGSGPSQSIRKSTIGMTYDYPGL